MFAENHAVDYVDGYESRENAILLEPLGGHKRYRNIYDGTYGNNDCLE